jgi:hypothetical protein
MRMPGKPSQVVVRNIIPKIVQQQERIIVGGAAEPEGAPEMYACSLEGWLGLAETLDWSNRHCRLLSFKGF